MRRFLTWLARWLRTSPRCEPRKDSLSEDTKRRLLAHGVAAAQPRSAMK